MSYLFIAAAPGSAPRRPVDFHDIAALFSEEECEHDCPAHPGAFSRALRAARLLLRLFDASAKALLAQGNAGWGIYGRRRPGRFVPRRPFSA